MDDSVDALKKRAVYIKAQTDAIVGEQLERIQLLQRTLVALEDQCKHEEEGVRQISSRVVGVRELAMRHQLELRSVQERVSGLLDIDKAIIQNIRNKFERDTQYWKFNEVADAAHYDKALAVEEVDHLNQLLYETREELRNQCLCVESAGRHGLKVLGERNQLSSELENHRSLLNHAALERDALRSRKVQLTSDVKDCDLRLGKLELENAASMERITGLVEQIADLGKRAIENGCDSGHHNSKQKIHRVLQMELANIKLRRENLMMSIEIRAHQKILKSIVTHRT